MAIWEHEHELEAGTEPLNSQSQSKFCAMGNGEWGFTMDHEPGPPAKSKRQQRASRK
jgi:hypothetical protein